jgi:pimeloyl-ACP methyl ester carboxylesterase
MKTIKLQLKRDRQMSFKMYGGGKTIFLLLHGIPGSSHAWETVIFWDLDRAQDRSTFQIFG